jgi:peroxiredoxin
LGHLGLALTLAMAGASTFARAGVPERIALADLRMKTADGRPVALGAPKGGATALVFYSSECPISNAYSPTLNRLSEEFPPQKLNLVGVCTDPDLSATEVAAHAKDFALKFPVVHDKELTLAAQIGATITPEAFVIDDQGRIRYHGRIDDQFAARQKRNANPLTRELHDAIAAVLAGRAVVPSVVPAVGCPIAKPLKKAAQPTYSDAVAAILQKNCVECHRRGQVAPFALETYAQASKRADDIAAVAEDRKMPPWMAAAQAFPAFKHNRSLNDADIATLTAWAAGGAPEGDPANVPPPPSFASDWALGTPDLVVELPTDYAVPADGNDIYRCFVIPTHLTEDRYVAAVEYQPGNRRVVHHIIAYVDTSGQARKKDAEDDGPGYTCFGGPRIEIHGDLGGWAPGNEPSRLPDGVGRLLPANADVVVQVHYHPSGKPETDRSRLGIHFSRTPVKQTMHWSLAGKFDLKIPPGAPNHEALAEWRIPVDVEALAVTPHMHLLGRDMRMWVTFPDGRDQDLINIPDWDFFWQNTYYFETPLTLPKGTVVKVKAHFDNSEANPHNPNKPPKEVKFGEGTTDEMCIGFIALTKKDQDLTRPGEKDDLGAIIRKDFENLRKKRER